jgi:multimeric flavodoxin WrbA
MKILIISGTPKKEGLCYSLVTAAYESAVGSGAETEIIRLADYDLSRCKMCGDGWGICFNEHQCKFGGENDGFNALQKKFAEADSFVFITPVYWGEVSEVLKTFLDKLRRCQATKQWDKKDGGESFLAGKKSILAASAGGSGGGIINALNEMERAVRSMGGNVYDFIGINRWNQEYKRSALKSAVRSMIKEIAESK